MRVFNSYYKRFLIYFCTTVLGVFTALPCFASFSELPEAQPAPSFETEVDITPISQTKKDKKETIKEAVYIKDIQIEGVNAVKPEYIMNRLKLQT